MRFAREVRAPAGAACQACLSWGQHLPPSALRAEVPGASTFRNCRRPRHVAYSGEVTAYGRTLYTHPDGRCADFTPKGDPVT
ncbi:hypothetical protein [Deinococcus multiflagellatus]|uniref:Uncharacterized protein n=1 Tax=Deinococcus multiflagellatus TaxID=1656887 RepID=A0ABW1ZRG7_9DEIO|nr:hypothetical protein [Deinococcus multiflagellatus]MBZ9715307.1 hypothetical protein [Deinococcus multiflagellatus]